jgi:hypothetical protein
MLEKLGVTVAVVLLVVVVVGLEETVSTKSSYNSKKNSSISSSSSSSSSYKICIVSGSLLNNNIITITLSPLSRTVYHSLLCRASPSFPILPGRIAEVSFRIPSELIRHYAFPLFHSHRSILRLFIHGDMPWSHGFESR